MTPPNKLLAILAASYKEKSLLDYAQEPAAMELAQNEELIARLEPLHLPEITKLICANPTLFERFKEEYGAVYPLYEDPSVETVERLLGENRNNAAFFAEKIFPLADEKILESFIQMFNRHNQEIEIKRDEFKNQTDQKSTLEKEINEKEQKLSEIVDGGKENKEKISSIRGIITKKKSTTEIY